MKKPLTKHNRAIQDLNRTTKPIWIILHKLAIRVGQLIVLVIAFQAISSLYLYHAEMFWNFIAILIIAGVASIIVWMVVKRF